ncbi:MAG: hypothetical protein GX443_11560 [Deltaproteobacteria bacterium]|nr:hypothetical protein [Deltaproteobacteria bacterium]
MKIIGGVAIAAEIPVMLGCRVSQRQGALWDVQGGKGMVAYRIVQLIPAEGWEVELFFEDGSRELRPLAGIALVERVDDHGDWYREVVGVFPASDRSGFCTVYDCRNVTDVVYRQGGRSGTPQ